MKRILINTIFVLTAGMTAWAQENPEPVYGGEVTVSIAAQPPGWDPSASTSQEIARVTYHNVYEGLLRIQQDGTLVPQLAESWQVSEDRLTWTFTLRDDVEFHDGSDFSAKDVVAKFERAIDPESSHTHKEYYEAIQSVTGEGNRVTFILSEPSSSLLYNLARPDSIIYPAGTEESQRSQPIGTGPFRFVDWVPESEVQLERFEDYYLEGVPYLDAVTFRILPDANARFAALQAGDIDMVGVGLSPEAALQAQSDPTLKLTEGSNTVEVTMALNNARPPFDNPLVRQAITHAIDKEVIVNGANFGYGTPIGTFATPSEPYYLDINPYPYDPERARELLAQAGYPDGFQVRFELPEPYTAERRAGEVIAQQLTEVGIGVDLRVVEWTAWLSRIFNGGDYDMTIIGQSEPRDINVYANPDYYFHYDNPRVRDLLAQAERSADQGEQTRLYQEIATVIAENAASVWVFNPSTLIAAQRNLYGYWEDQPTPALDMTEVYLVE